MVCSLLTVIWIQYWTKSSWVISIVVETHSTVHMYLWAPQRPKSWDRPFSRSPRTSISRTTPIALLASPDLVCLSCLVLALQAEYQNTGLIYGPSSMAAIASP
jgi:hypothetical protein